METTTSFLKNGNIYIGTDGKPHLPHYKNHLFFLGFQRHNSTNNHYYVFNPSQKLLCINMYVVEKTVGGNYCLIDTKPNCLKRENWKLTFKKTVYIFFL